MIFTINLYVPTHKLIEIMDMAKFACPIYLFSHVISTLSLPKIHRICIFLLYKLEYKRTWSPVWMWIIFIGILFLRKGIIVWLFFLKRSSKVWICNLQGFRTVTFIISPFSYVNIYAIFFSISLMWLYLLPYYTCYDSYIL